MHGPLFDRLIIRKAPSLPTLRVEVRPQGLYLPHVDLYLDPRESVPRAFVSHGHADHTAALRTNTGVDSLTILSPETAALMTARYPDVAIPEPSRWNEAIPLASARVRIVPAGHILGAAALVLETDEGTLVYSGDVKPSAGLTHGAAALPRCDVLVIESTFGLPIFSFPPDSANHESLLAFAREALAAGETPVILAYALGKAQEVAQHLGSHGIPVRAHGSMTRLNEAYRALGVALPNVRPYLREDTEPASAIIVPPRERFGGMFKRSRGAGIRVAYVSGWALLDASRERFDADLQVPLSDHASFAELDALVDQCAPRRVYVTHGFAAAYARHLRTRGFDAEPLEATGYEA